MANLKLPYLATAALSGALFGSGLYVSQMVDPLKVLRFLDFTAIPSGGWDPSLAFVMGAALIVMFIAVAILVFLMLFIVPKFETMFAELGKDAELPMISQVVFGTSKFFLNATLVPPVPNRAPLSAAVAR